jgi:indoleamine 2,3-dioxygenase
MHTFDVFLGIEHPYAEGPGSGCAAFDPHKRSTSSSSTFDYPLTPPPSPTRLRSSTHSFQTRPSLVDTSFIPRMRSYMPGPHQLFLSEFPSRPSMLFRNTPSLQPSYNACVMALKRFRDNHIRIVTQYVICPARSVPQKLGEESQPVRGTGGTALVPLLKVYRDTTHSACV